MSLFSCQHSSVGEPNLCRCPAWEESEEEGSDVKFCDTCGHRAEWHLSPVELPHGILSTLPLETERCKASLTADCHCSCPTWIPPDTKNKSSGCALCGHKKGWHRPKASATTSLQNKVDNLRPGYQHSSASARMRMLSESDAGSSLSRSSSVSWMAPSPEPFALYQEFSSKAPGAEPLDLVPPALEARVSSSLYTPISSTSREASSHYADITPLQLATEHMRFILDDLEECEEPAEKPACLTASVQPEDNQNSISPLGRRYSISSNSNSTRSIRALQSPIKQMASPQTQSTGAVPLDILAHRSRHPTVQSDDWSLGDEKDVTDGSETSTTTHYTQIPRPPAESFTILQSDVRQVVDLSRVAENTAVRPRLPLIAKISSQIYVDEPIISPIAPQSASGATDRCSDPNSNRVAQPKSALRPFQDEGSLHFNFTKLPSSNPAMITRSPSSVKGRNCSSGSVTNQSVFTGVVPKAEVFEAFPTETRSMTLHISPPPSTYVFSPGEKITIVVRLKSSPNIINRHSITEFESQLSKWKNIHLKLQGMIDTTGRVDDETQHEIICLEKKIHGVDEPVPISESLDWRFEFVIPTHVNCECGPAQLPLPSSCSNSVGHVRYLVSLSGKRRRNLLSSSNEGVFAQLNVRSNLPIGSKQLLTKPITTRIPETWNSFSGDVKAAVTGASLIYQVELTGLDSLRIPYQFILYLSSDSEVLESTLNKVLASTVLSLHPPQNASLRATFGDEPNFSCSDVRLESCRVENSSSTCKVSGYLEVTKLPQPSPPLLIEMGTLSPYHPVSQSRLHSEPTSNLSKWVINASLQTVLLCQPVHIVSRISNLQSTCSVRHIIQATPLPLRWE